MGSTGTGTSSDTQPAYPEEHFRGPLQQVAGYPGSAEQRIAIERGELDGDCGAWSSIPLEWIDEQKIVPVIRSSPATAPDMPPTSLQRRHRAERARTGRHCSAAGVDPARPAVHRVAAVPAERVRILREAFTATMKDPAVHRRNAEASPADLADHRRGGAQIVDANLRDPAGHRRSREGCAPGLERVIQGRGHKPASPEKCIFTNRGYRFRAPRCTRPRNDALHEVKPPAPPSGTQSSAASKDQSPLRWLIVRS